MNQPTDPRDQLFDLASAYCDGQATESDVTELEGLIEADDAARRSFLAYALVHGQLPLVADQRPQGTSDKTAPRNRWSLGRWSIGSLFRFGRAAAVFVAIAATLGLGFRLTGNWLADNTEPPLATLTAARFALPPDSQARLWLGQAIGPGRFEIASGAAELVLKNGVVLLVDGASELDLVDELRAILRSGSVVVRVPKGMSGFRLDTATAKVLDLGTEFAVRIGRDLVTDVQVYDGAVIANGVGSGALGFPCRIEAGGAQRFSATAAADPELIPFDELRFLRSLPPEPSAGLEFISSEEDERQFGRPVHDRIKVLAAPPKVTIDGRLDEWPATPGFRSSFRGETAAEWAEGWMMYDADRLYIAARVGDPAPLESTISPDLDADKGWVGGGVQVRISTDRLAGWPVAGNSPSYYGPRNRPELPTAAEKAAATNPKLGHLVMWHHAPTGRACLSLAYGMLHAEHVGNPSGYEGKFSPLPDGRGYVLEYAIPWSLLAADDDPPRAGDVLAAAWQVHFADESGRIWRRQIIDIRNPNEPYRIGGWQRAATWGRAEFE